MGELGWEKAEWVEMGRDLGTVQREGGSGHRVRVKREKHGGLRWGSPGTAERKANLSMTAEGHAEELKHHSTLTGQAAVCFHAAPPPPQ